jgi:hypothetical protein
VLKVVQTLNQPEVEGLDHLDYLEKLKIGDQPEVIRPAVSSLIVVHLHPLA